MSGLKGNVRKLSELGSRLKNLTVETRQRVAARVAPTITKLALATFDARANAYGDAWGPSVARHNRGKGVPISLVKSGRMRSTMRFVAIGTRVRCALGVKYAKYHIGYYQMLPPGGKAMPIAWAQAIAKISREEALRQVGGVLS